MVATISISRVLVLTVKLGRTRAGADTATLRFADHRITTCYGDTPREALRRATAAGMNYIRRQKRPGYVKLIR